MSESHGDVIEAPPELRAASVISGMPPRTSSPAPASANDSQQIGVIPESKPEPGADEIRGALKQADGRVAEAARTLGLSSRYALYRLLKKHGIDPDAPI